MSIAKNIKKNRNKNEKKIGMMLLFQWDDMSPPVPAVTLVVPSRITSYSEMGGDGVMQRV